MATETAVPDQVTNEHLEGKNKEELKAIEQEPVTLLKTEELETPKVTESGEKTEVDKHQPAVMEVEKVNDALGLDGPTEEIAAVIEDADPKSDVISVSEPAIKDTMIETGQSETSGVPEPSVESVEKSFNSPLALESGTEIETKQEVSQEEPKIAEKAGSDVEPEAENKPEVLLSETEKVDSQSTVKEPDARTVELPASVVEVEEKPLEKFENVEVVENIEKLEPKENEGEVANEKDVSVNEANEVLVTDSSTEKESSIGQETVAYESSDALAPETIKVPTEEGALDFLDASDKTLGDNAQKEESGVDVVESAREVSLEAIKADEENLEKNVKDDSAEPVTTTSVYLDASDKALGDNTQKGEPAVDVVGSVNEASLKVISVGEENLEKTVKDEELTESVTAPAKEIGDTTAATEITERPVSEHTASGDTEMVTADEKVDNAKDDLPASVETTKDTELLPTKTEEGADSSSTKNIVEESFEGQKTTKDVEVVIEEKKPEEADGDIVPVDTPKGSETQSLKTEGGDDSVSAVEVAEKPFEEKVASKDVEVVTEEKKEESVEDGTTTLVEPKDADLEGKVDLNTVNAVDEMVVESKELDLESKTKDISETDGNKLTKEAEVAEETTKLDSQNLEDSKATDESKITEDPSKEVLTKPAQKHSNKIMSKVKQSLVKVRKAITGKSASPKPMTADSKEDITVK